MMKYARTRSYCTTPSAVFKGAETDVRGGGYTSGYMLSLAFPYTCLPEIDNAQKYFRVKGLDLLQCRLKLSTMKDYLLQHRRGI